MDGRFAPVLWRLVPVLALLLAANAALSHAGEAKDFALVGGDQDVIGRGSLREHRHLPLDQRDAAVGAPGAACCWVRPVNACCSSGPSSK